MQTAGLAPDPHSKGSQSVRVNLPADGGSHLPFVKHAASVQHNEGKGGKPRSACVLLLHPGAGDLPLTYKTQLVGALLCTSVFVQ